MSDQFSTVKICISVTSYSHKENNDTLYAICNCKQQKIDLNTIPSHDHLCRNAASQHVCYTALHCWVKNLYNSNVALTIQNLYEEWSSQ